MERTIEGGLMKGKLNDTMPTPNLINQNVKAKWNDISNVSIIIPDLQLQRYKKIKAI